MSSLLEIHPYCYYFYKSKARYKVKTILAFTRVQSLTKNSCTQALS